jgi:hypothetical protein
MNRSASVDLPWSMWAMMEKLRISCTFFAGYPRQNKGAPEKCPAGRTNHVEF